MDTKSIEQLCVPALLVRGVSLDKVQKLSCLVANRAACKIKAFTGLPVFENHPVNVIAEEINCVCRDRGC